MRWDEWGRQIHPQFTTDRRTTCIFWLGQSQFWFRFVRPSVHQVQCPTSIAIAATAASVNGPLGAVGVHNGEPWKFPGDECKLQFSNRFVFSFPPSHPPPFSIFFNIACPRLAGLQYYNEICTLHSTCTSQVPPLIHYLLVELRKRS